ncbi:thymic stromal lymphopoietin [Vulpes vulpes]|uniref:Thymic stromal lymphopoietin n=1 Tax=Vulpes vulpes TaxID=9627 RepID=A0ABM4YLV2_VULVU
MQVEPPGRLLSSAPTPIRIAQPSEEIRLQLLLADLLLAPLMSQQMNQALASSHNTLGVDGGEGQPDFFPKRCCHDPPKIQPWTWKIPEKPVCQSWLNQQLTRTRSVLPDALLSVLSVFFRKIFVLQLVGLVLTYNFIDCDFEKIRRKYQEVIYQALEKYMDGTRSTEFSHAVYCADPPDCLARIERLTLHRIRGCASGAREAFAEGTVAALAAECPGYAAAPINNTQAKKKRKKREVTANKCQEQVAHLIGLWRRFSRIS